MEPTEIIPNDGMTADTAPGQQAAQAESNAQTNVAPTSNSTQGADERAQKFIDALHALEKGEGDAQAVAALFAQNATLANAALELTGKKIEGREAIAAFWEEYKATLGEAYSEFHQITANANAAGLFWTTQSAEASQYHGATALQFNAAGEIEFFRGYYDTRELDVKQ